MSQKGKPKFTENGMSYTFEKNSKDGELKGIALDNLVIIKLIKCTV